MVGDIHYSLSDTGTHTCAAGAGQAANTTVITGSREGQMKRFACSVAHH